MRQFQFLSTPLQAVLCTMVIFSYGKILNKLYGNYSLWYVSDYILSSVISMTIIIDDQSKKFISILLIDCIW